MTISQPNSECPLKFAIYTTKFTCPPKFAIYTKKFANYTTKFTFKFKPNDIFRQKFKFKPKGRIK